MAVNDANREVYTFGGFRLDGTKRLLFGRDGEPLRLMPKGFDILHYLVTHSGRPVDKEELLSAVWHDTIVEENNLTQNISAIRRLLGEKHRENRFIATIPGRGYEFVAPVEIASDSQDGTGQRPVASGNLHPARKRHLAVYLVIGLVAVGALATLLYRMQTAAPERSIDSLAVLPFKPMSAGDRDESLEMGMADTLISKLSAGQIKVRPLAVVRRFARPDQDPVEAGRQLGVDAVLDGGIQIVADRVRVSTKLIRVADGSQMWSAQFDEQLTDIFAVQDSISRKVASQLRTPLASHSRRDYTENVEAYRLYLKGRLHSSRLILAEVQQAIPYYDEAIAEDPSFALAYVELSNSYRAMVLTNDGYPKQMMPKARAAAEKAVQLDADLAEAWTALAFCDFWYDWDWNSAEEHFKKALELDPNSARTHAFYAHFLSNLGRHEQAIEEVQRARQIDQLDLLTQAMEGQILTFAGKDEESLKALQSVIAIDPSFWLAHLFISRVYIKENRWDEAVLAAAKAADLTGGNAEALATKAFALAKSGRGPEARKILTTLEARGQTHFVPSYVIAAVALALSDRARALDLLEQSFEQREPLMVFLKVEPKWNDLRDEPRFVNLLHRMNFEPAQSERGRGL